MYTFREKTLKNRTVGEAVASAERVLRKRGIRSTCINAVSGMQMSDLITLERLNEISAQIISDTEYHAVDSDYF